MPGMQRRLIEVVSTQAGGNPSQAIIRWREYLPKEGDVARRHIACQGSSGVTWGDPVNITATMNADSHPFSRIANVTRGDRGRGGGGGGDTDELGADPNWHWMKVTENTSPTRADRLVYNHTPDDKWRTTRPFGINHREDPQKKHPGGMTVHLDRNTVDLATHEGVWGDKCAERVEGEDVVLSYSDGSMKEAGSFGSGAWYVKGGTLRYSHKEFPG